VEWRRRSSPKRSLRESKHFIEDIIGKCDVDSANEAPKRVYLLLDQIIYR